MEKGGGVEIASAFSMDEEDILQQATEYAISFDNAIVQRLIVYNSRKECSIRKDLRKGFYSIKVWFYSCLHEKLIRFIQVLMIK